MLLVKGTVLEVKSEVVRPPGGTPFESVTFNVLTGKSDVEEVRAGRDLLNSEYPIEGEECELVAAVSAFGRKNGGAGYRLTAIGRVA